MMNIETVADELIHFKTKRMLDNELRHIGIKGMRWGNRKAKTSNPTSSKPKSEPKPHAGMLTDTEIRNRIARIKLENEYRQLTTPPPSATKKFVTDVLMTAFKSTATAYTAKYMTKGLESLIKTPPPPPPRPNP